MNNKTTLILNVNLSYSFSIQYKPSNDEDCGGDTHVKIKYQMCF